MRPSPPLQGALVNRAIATEPKLVHEIFRFAKGRAGSLVAQHGRNLYRETKQTRAANQLGDSHTCAVIIIDAEPRSVRRQAERASGDAVPSVGTQPRP